MKRRTLAKSGDEQTTTTRLLELWLFVSRKSLLNQVWLLSVLSFMRSHVQFFSDPQALLNRHSSKDPKLILAVPTSMSHGPSRNVFVDFAVVPENVILLTGRSEEGTLSRVLFDRWNALQQPEDRWDMGKIGNAIHLDGTLKLQV